MVVNKIDQQPWETLEAEKQQKVQALADDANCSLMTMSNVSEKGVSEVKIAACDKLLNARVDARISGNKIDGILNRLQVTNPAPRDNVQRQPFIPESVQRARESGTINRPTPQRSRTGYAPTKDDMGSAQSDNDDGDIVMAVSEAARKTARDLMWENGGPGVWAPDYREQYDLENDEWKFDAIPEIIDGKNIADFVDPDILKRVEALEEEEDQIVAELEAAKMNEDEDSDLDEEEEAAVMAIRAQKKIIKGRKLAVKTQNKPMVPLSIRAKSTGSLEAKEIKKRMDTLGVDSSKMLERGRSREREERGRKRERSLTRKLEESRGVEDDGDIDMSDASPSKKTKKERNEERRRELSQVRSHSKSRDPSQKGLKDDKDILKKVEKLERQGQSKWAGGAGEGDNRKSVHLLKWCNTGKKRNGTHYQR